jgi:hypothetical protein
VIKTKDESLAKHSMATKQRKYSLLPGSLTDGLQQDG